MIGLTIAIVFLIVMFNKCTREAGGAEFCRL